MSRQRPRAWVWLVLGGAAAAAVGLAATANTFVRAADHLDPPTRTNPTMGGTDRNADIADVYAWYRGAGTTRSLVTIMSFSGPNPAAAGQEIPCDRDVLYEIHISNDADVEPEV